MKKIIILAAAALVSVAAIAQPRAIGGRAGINDEVSYQHSIGNNFVEIDLGFQGVGGIGIGASAVYDFSLATPDWTPKGTWEVYAGPGIALGTHFNAIPFYFGVCGQVGLSYTFWFPLQLSVDIKPIVGFQAGTASGFYTPGLYGFVPTLGVRYCFGK